MMRTCPLPQTCPGCGVGEAGGAGGDLESVVHPRNLYAKRYHFHQGFQEKKTGWRRGA